MPLAPDGPLHPSLALAAVAAALVAIGLCRAVGVRALLAPILAAVCVVSWATGRGGWLAAVAVLALGSDRLVDRRARRVALAISIALLWRFAGLTAVNRSSLVAHGAALVVALGVAGLLVSLRSERARAVAVVLAGGWLWGIVPDTETALIFAAAASTVVAADALLWWAGHRLRRTPTILGGISSRNGGSSAGPGDDRGPVAVGAALGIGAATVWALAAGVAGRTNVAPQAVGGLFAVLAIVSLTARRREVGPALRSRSHRPVHQR
jgi:hypothetical protein